MAAERPWVDFAEVKAKITIPDVLEALGIAGQFRPSKDGLAGVCPLPQHRHGPRPNASQFRIDCRRGVWLYRCFGDCAETELGGGDVITFVQAMTGLSPAHCRFWFHEHFGDRLDGKKPKARNGPIKEEAREVGQAPQRAESKALSSTTLPEPAEPLKPLRFRLRLDPDALYLKERGLRPETVARYGIGFCNRGLLKGYVAIPVFRFPREDADENPVAYLGRWPGDDFDEADGRSRYKWPEGFAKSRVIYGLQEALDVSAPRDPLILVEGCFDVFRLAQAGYAAVASFGATLSDEQARLLIGTGRSISIMFDGNDAGRRGQAAAVEKLQSQVAVRSVRLADGEEPDRLSNIDVATLLGDRRT